MTTIEGLQHQLDDALHRAESLRRFIDLISRELALEPLLTRLIECATDLIGAHYGSIGLVKDYPDGPVIRIAAVVNMPPLELGAEFLPGVGLAGSVLQQQRAISAERYGDLDLPSIPEFAEHAVIGMPIWQNQTMIGFFGIGAEPPHRFSERDAETLMIFSRHAAIAIENARRFEQEQRRNQRLSLITAISRLLTNNLGSDTQFQTAVETIAQHFGFAYVAVAMISPDDPETLVPFAWVGTEHAAMSDPEARRHVRNPPDQAAHTAAHTRQWVMTDLPAHNGSTHAAEHAATATELDVPIVVSDRLLGVITIQSQQPIDPDDIEGMTIIADQFGVALEHARLFGSMQHALEIMQFLFAVSQRLSTAMRVEEVIAAYLEQVAAHGRYACSIVLLEIDHLERRTAMTIRGRWAPQGGIHLHEERWDFLHAPFTPILDAGQTLTFADVYADARVPSVLRDMQRQYGQVALAMIPLMVRGKRTGLVLLSCPHAYEWIDSDLQPFQATAAQLATAIESRQQHLLLSKKGQQLAVLEERRRLARELHDSVTQSLFSMSLLAQVVPDLWDADQEEAREALSTIRDLTRGALAEMRELLFELRPADADEHSLAQMLRQHAAACERRSGSTVVVEVDEEMALPTEVGQALLRIAQEALTNISRHAAAQRVSISLQGENPTRLRIVDNGRGFDPEQVSQTSFGLISMRERATNINAHFQVRSAPGQGSEIRVVWPQPTDEAAHDDDRKGGV